MIFQHSGDVEIRPGSTLQYSPMTLVLPFGITLLICCCCCCYSSLFLIQRYSSSSFYIKWMSLCLETIFKFTVILLKYVLQISDDVASSYFKSILELNPHYNWFYSDVICQSEIIESEEWIKTINSK